MSVKIAHPSGQAFGLPQDEVGIGNMVELHPEELRSGVSKDETQT